MVHQLSLVSYYIKFENFKIPKCPFCGKNCKLKKGLVFRKSCDNIECQNKAHSHKHSKKTRQLLRRKQVEFLKKRLGGSAWERRNKRELSSLEQWFFDFVLQKHKLFEKFQIINEHCIFPYFIDFAFIDIKLAVELDGPAHFSHGRIRLEHDFKKDQFLISRGWKVYRIPYYEKSNEKILDFLKYLNGEIDGHTT